MKYYVDSIGGDTNGFKKGLGKALASAINGNTKQLLIRVGTLANVQGIMSDVLGDNFVKSLVKTKHQSINIEGITIEIFLESDNSRRSSFTSGTVFTPWATRKILSETISDYKTIDHVYVPWMDDEKNDYIANHPDAIQI